MDFNDTEIKKFNLSYGDLLICEGGEVGRCAIWRDNLEDCYFQKALHRVRVNKTVLTSEYLQEYFFWMAKLGGLNASVSEVTFSHLTAEKLKELKVPLPPITLQNQFAERIQQIEQQKQQAQASLEKSEALFNSLLQCAFTSELTQHLAA
jgi:type I restriction enzyme S subunit